ncbi:hypothetical protein SF12_16900, partial [Streptomyces sp. MBRL 601]
MRQFVRPLRRVEPDRRVQRHYIGPAVTGPHLPGPGMDRYEGQGARVLRHGQPGPGEHHGPPGWARWEQCVHRPAEGHRERPGRHGHRPAIGQR